MARPKKFQGPRVQVPIRLDPLLKERMREAAKAAGESMNDLAAVAIQRELDKRSQAARMRPQPSNYGWSDG